MKQSINYANKQANKQSKTKQTNTKTSLLCCNNLLVRLAHREPGSALLLQKNIKKQTNQTAQTNKHTNKTNKTNKRQHKAKQTKQTNNNTSPAQSWHLAEGSRCCSQTRPSSQPQTNKHANNQTTKRTIKQTNNRLNKHIIKQTGDKTNKLTNIQ